jgi:hypothetical protein
MDNETKLNPTTLALTKAGAIAVKAAIREGNELHAMLVAKQGEIKRLTDMIQADAGIDPEQWLLEGTKEENGATLLKLIPKPPTPTPPIGV